MFADYLGMAAAEGHLASPSRGLAPVIRPPGRHYIVSAQQWQGTMIDCQAQ
jgi:hypothetical protein